MLQKLWLFGIACLFAIPLSAQLTIRIIDVPDVTPEDGPIFLAGTVNNWNQGHPDYKLTKISSDTFEITLNIQPQQVLYKFTRGTWENVESTAEGGFLNDRHVMYTGGEQLEEVLIWGWSDLSQPMSTAADNVQIIADDFAIPQLDRTRRIWIYLPPDYTSSNKSYPVLYMHDAQNLFDNITSFSGEWEVDEHLNQLFDDGDDGVIVVGIDNGSDKRIDEFSPWVNNVYGGGEGDEYVAFIVENLKPYIDDNYRTRPERAHTGIMGSSMGGLISMYAAIEYQGVFSKAGLFSPSFWFTDEVYQHVTTTGKQANMRFYLMGGENESASMVADLNQMYQTLTDAGFSSDELVLLTHADGQHMEWYWSREFSDAYEWLYENSSTGLSELAKRNQIQLFPNPADSILQLISQNNFKDLRVEIYSIDGQSVIVQNVSSNQTIAIEQLKSGIYVANFFTNQRFLGSQKLIIR